MLHDVDLAMLVSGPDKERMKSITRTEVTSTKVHSTIVSVPPVFVFATSNQHLMDHAFPTALKTSLGENKVSRANVNIKGAQIEDVNAVKNRFIEIFVRKKPRLPLDCLPKHGNFTRKNFINGVWALAVEILFRYEKSDFASPYMYLYPLIGIAKNLNIISSKLMRDGARRGIASLMQRYQLENEEIIQINASLPPENF